MFTQKSCGHGLEPCTVFGGSEMGFEILAQVLNRVLIYYNLMAYLKEKEEEEKKNSHKDHL